MAQYDNIKLSKKRSIGRTEHDLRRQTNECILRLDSDDPWWQNGIPAVIGFRTGPLKSSGGEDEDSDLNSVLAEVSEVEVGRRWAAQKTVWKGERWRAQI